MWSWRTSMPNIEVTVVRITLIRSYNWIVSLLKGIPRQPVAKQMDSLNYKLLWRHRSWEWSHKLYFIFHLVTNVFREKLQYYSILSSISCVSRWSWSRDSRRSVSLSSGHIQWVRPLKSMTKIVMQKHNRLNPAHAISELCIKSRVLEYSKTVWVSLCFYYICF